MKVHGWDGKYIRFDTVTEKEPLEYTKGVLDGIGYALSRVSNYSEAYNNIRLLAEKLKEEYRSKAHYHFSDMGPFCVACGCNLPGPEGQWE